MIFGYKVFFMFFFVALIAFIGPRLENSMDEVICGQRIANHKYLGYNIIAIIFLCMEIGFDIIINID